MSQSTPASGEIQTGTAGTTGIAHHETSTKLINGTSDRVSLGVLLVTFLGGLWLMAAPFLVGYQPRTSHWADGTVSIFAVGGAVSVIALVTGIGLVGGYLFDLSRTARSARHGEQDTTDNPS